MGQDNLRNPVHSDRKREIHPAAELKEDTVMELEVWEAMTCMSQ